MPTNESYIQLRRDVLELDEQASQYCFCKAIDGGCCKRDLKMLPEDQAVITEAIERGEISPATLERALVRAMDDDQEFCPWLGDAGECTIYPHRPVVCIQHGNGGLPKDKATALRAMRNPGNKTIRVRDLEQFSCDACAEQFSPNDKIPLSVAGKSVAILITIQQGEQHYGRLTMNRFLIDRFSGGQDEPDTAPEQE